MTLYNDNGSTRFITVAQLNGYIRNILHAEEMLQGVLVLGEVSGFKISGQHAYFTLKDGDACVQCSNFNYAKGYVTHEGEGVIVKGNVDYYAKTGKLSLVVSKIEPVGVGALYVELERLKKKLAEEGLFDSSLKKPLPRILQNVCVLTSKTGAVIQDIKRTIRLKNSALDIYFYDVRVQGAGAELTIINALKAVDNLGFDCIIIARGGGSFEDLFCFNDEKLARAIVAARTPIVSAVGHETDFTICDLVADIRAATPTAAAELVAYDVEALRDFFASTIQNGLISLNSRLNADVTAFSGLSSQLFDKYKSLYSTKHNELKRLSELLFSKTKGILDMAEMKLRGINDYILSANPEHILGKGYYRVVDKGGLSVDFSTLKVGSQVKIISNKAVADATIDNIGIREDV